MVANRHITREDFARSVLHSEFEVNKKTREFLLKYPLGDVNAKDNPQYAFKMKQSGDFSEYLRDWETSKNQTDNPFEYYRKQYDRIQSEHKTGLKLTN
jgi:hypothetical protein